MLEEEYQLDYFHTNGLKRKVCSKCGAAFWTRDPAKETCGDAPCEPYGFIGNPVFSPHSLDEMREAFLSFLKSTIIPESSAIPLRLGGGMTFILR